MESALPSWHSTRNIHSNPVQGCKYNFSISLVLFPSCPQEQSGTCCKREGKTKVGRSVAVPRSQPALPKAVFFTALAASFSAPHRIPRAQTFLPSRRATVSWLAKVQTSHAGISFEGKKAGPQTILTMTWVFYTQACQVPCPALQGLQIFIYTIKWIMPGSQLSIVTSYEGLWCVLGLRPWWRVPGAVQLLTEAGDLSQLTACIWPSALEMMGVYPCGHRLIHSTWPWYQWVFLQTFHVHV